MLLEAKGSVVKYVCEFAKDEYPDIYNKWLLELPKESREIMQNPIFATEWYDLEAGIVVPTRHLARMLGRNASEFAFESGQYSAEKALGGIYKIFIAIANPKFVIGRAASMFNSFYRPAVITSSVQEEGKKGAMRVEKFPARDLILDYRIAGWIQVAIEKSSGKNVRVSIVASTAKGDPYSEFLIEWE